MQGGSQKNAAGTRSFGADLEELLDETREALLQKLARRAYVEGELLRASKAKWNWWLTIRDADRDATIESFVPLGHEPPTVGHVVGITGRYKVKRLLHEPMLKIQFEGFGFRDLGPSKRQGSRLALIEALRSRLCTRTLEKPPKHIVVLGTYTAMKEFRAGLGAAFVDRFRPEFRPLRFETCPADIACAIEQAAQEQPCLLIIAKGGGPAIDLDRFNEPVVVEAVARAASQVAVGLGLGYTNYTCDAEQFGSLKGHSAHGIGHAVRMHIENVCDSENESLRKRVSSVVQNSGALNKRAPL